MKVEKVSANIRYSQDTGHGAWKVIEIGAEGTVDPARLFEDLSRGASGRILRPGRG